MIPTTKNRGRTVLGVRIGLRSVSKLIVAASLNTSGSGGTEETPTAMLSVVAGGKQYLYIAESSISY